MARSRRKARAAHRRRRAADLADERELLASGGLLLVDLRELGREVVLQGLEQPLVVVHNVLQADRLLERRLNFERVRVARPLQDGVLPLRVEPRLLRGVRRLLPSSVCASEEPDRPCSRSLRACSLPSTSSLREQSRPLEESMVVWSPLANCERGNILV